jgi:RNA recognition motif-containing protein
MSSQAEAQAAIAGLNGTELQGRTLTVNEAKPREDRSSGGSRSGGYNSGRAGGGGGNRW